MHLQTMTDASFLNCVLITSRISLIFSLEDPTLMISRFYFRIHQTSTSLQSSWNELKPRHADDAGSASCLCVRFFLWFLLVDTVNCVERVFLSTHSDSQYPIFYRNFNIGTPEGWKITAVQYRFLALLLVYRDFSGFSETFNAVLYCRWWNHHS